MHEAFTFLEYIILVGRLHWSHATNYDKLMIKSSPECVTEKKTENCIGTLASFVVLVLQWFIFPEATHYKPAPLRCKRRLVYWKGNTIINWQWTTLLRNTLSIFNWERLKIFSTTLNYIFLSPFRLQTIIKLSMNNQLGFWNLMYPFKY